MNSHSTGSTHSAACSAETYREILGRTREKAVVHTSDAYIDLLRQTFSNCIAFAVVRIFEDKL